MSGCSGILHATSLLFVLATWTSANQQFEWEPTFCYHIRLGLLVSILAISATSRAPLPSPFKSKSQIFLSILQSETAKKWLKQRQTELHHVRSCPHDVVGECLGECVLVFVSQSV